MLPIRLIPEKVEFVLLSFEGPDPYSKAGGLGVRISNLAHFLASQGFQTHLIFIGSPDLPGMEQRLDGRLKLYRWCQWISRYHSLGVYDGEEGKLADFNYSAPPFIIEQIARPAIGKGRHIVILAEEWHTAEALTRLSDQLHAQRLRQYSILLWNANNTKGFERIDWERLNYVATLTTVSRYMKQIMRTYGFDPLIIPNGIPSELLQPPTVTSVNQVRRTLAENGTLLLFKVGRYDPDKCWLSAIEAAAQLKREGQAIHFLCRGGIEGYGSLVLQHARESGLLVIDVEGHPETWSEALEAIREAGPVDIYNLRFSMSPSMLHVFYAAADFVLANSKHEPFGLVGLEAMAAGGVVFTGPTGETYSSDGQGAIALDTESPGELVLIVESLRKYPEKAQAIRQVAPFVAGRYTWENVVNVLFEKITLAACYQNTGPLPSTWLDLHKPLPDLLDPALARLASARQTNTAGASRRRRASKWSLIPKSFSATTPVNRPTVSRPPGPQPSSSAPPTQPSQPRQPP
jgi:glycosyltransferase involved in cell wall biosynthesis